MIEKSPEAFRTISEVSRMLAVPTHVLRFWETKFTQLRPVKKNGGRRYYRPEDIILLKAIQNLLHNEGYTIKGAQQVLRNFSKNGKFGNGRDGDAHVASVHANAE
ncbi:MAG: MerR family transcriptional regulator, partial [Proteobacteria bacterium]|nr:MerR family transcriptional regulator [Pseudomonadota bacterium]